jgi:hypothetical protein
MKERAEPDPSNPEVERDEATILRLKQQVDVYPVPENGHGVADLGPRGKAILLENTKGNTKTYRDQFIEFAVRLSQDEASNYKGTDELRKTKPGEAAIKAEDLFGPKGLELYKRALQEEMGSPHYRAAVFNESTKFIEGPKWQKPPVIIIGGPSGCGKTYATDAVIKQISQMPQHEHDKSGNLIATVDGGIGREVSQMRKLAIRVANMKGYTGVADLHKESEVLEPIKKTVMAAALEDDKFGLAIPETFAFWINPFDNGKKNLSEMADSNKRELIFSRVVGENADTFQSVVYEMGTKRAWKKDGFEDLSLDLNSRVKLPESKAYGAGGFHFGKAGSNSAAAAYVDIQKERGKPDLSMVVVNDLILVHQVSGPGETWQPAKKGDEGIFLVSERVFKAWSALKPEERTQGLREYSAQNAAVRVEKSEPLEELLTNPERHTILAQADLKQRLQAMKKATGAKEEDDIELQTIGGHGMS